MNTSTRKSYTAYIIGLIAFIIILSLAYFSHQSLRLDESQSLWQTGRTPAKILNILAQDVHVPVYHMLLHYWQMFLGNSVFGARMLSLVFFIASIPALYLLGKRAFNSSIGFFAATLLAVSPFMNWYGNEIRMYSLMVLITVLSQYFFLGIYKKQDTDSWIGYVVTTAIGIYVHYFFFFVLLVEALFFFMYKSSFQRAALKRFLLIVVMVVIMFAPWVIYVKTLGTISNEAPLLAAPNSVNLFNTFSQFIFGFQNDHLNTILVSLWPITVLLGFLALRKNKYVTPEVVYFVMSVLIPIAIAFVVSITILPLFVSRYLILTIPSLYLVVGWVFSTYPPKLQRVLKYILVGAMVAGLVVEIVNPIAPVKEDYREATEYIETKAAPQDIILLSAPFTVYPVEYYYHGATDIQTIPSWDRFAFGAIPPFSEENLAKQIDDLKQYHYKAYILLSYDQGYEEDIRLYMDKNYQRVEVKQFSENLNLYVYQLRYDKPVLGGTGTTQ